MRSALCNLNLSALSGFVCMCSQYSVQYHLSQYRRIGVDIDYVVLDFEIPL